MPHKTKMVVSTLTTGEVERIMKAAQEGSARPMSDEELREVVAWADRAKLESIMLDMVLDGRVILLGFRDGRMVFAARESLQ